MEKYQVFHRTALANYLLFLTVFLLLYPEQHSRHCWTPTTHEEVQALSYVTIRTSCEFNLQVLRQIGFHNLLDIKVPVLLFLKPILQKSNNLQLVFFLQLQIFHVLVKNDKVDPELVSSQRCPDDGFGDVVDNVRINNKTKAHSSQSPRSLIGIIRSNITITNLAHRIDSPINGVKVLKMPRQGIDGRKSSWTLKPTN